MPIEYNDVRELKGVYEDLYRPRHEAFRALRKFWHGDYWKLADYEQSRPITSIFRDLTQHMSDIGPEIKLVYNVIHSVVNKYQSFLAPLPLIRMWNDAETDRAKAQAVLKQRYLYGCWDASDMNRLFANIGWYLPLMGDCYLGIHPDFDRSIPKALIRSPEFAYPIPTYDKHDESAVIFSWKVHETVVAKNFVEYQAPVEQLRRDRQGKFKRGQATDPQVEILEYSDDYEWHRWISQISSTKDNNNDVVVGAVEVNGVEHNLGFNLFDHLKFIDVPDEPWGHGAVEQAINLNEMGNALYSLLFQAVIENVFPRLVLENPAAAPEEIESGPGAVIPLLAGGKAYYLQPEGPMIQGQAEFLRTNELNIRNAVGMPGVNFGESPASSIVTGKAVNELEGAGTGSQIELVQGVGIGDGIVNWNEKAITIGQKMFRNDTMNLFGMQFSSFVDIVPKQFQLSIKGSQLIGSPRNDVIFSPALNPHEKLVMGLQGLGGGIWSKKYVREQMGIIDNEQMVEEILAEQVEDGVLAGILATFQQQPEPANAQDAEDQAFAYLQGKTAPSAPHPLTQLGGAPPPGGPPVAGGPAGPPAGPAGAPVPGAPAGAPPGPGGLPGPQAPTPGGAPAGGLNVPLTLDAVAAAFQAVQGIQGRVFLVGEIVQRGKTSNQIEVAITNPADKQTLMQGLPQYANKLQIINTDGEPRERFLEVTPGAAQTPGGGGTRGQANPQQLQGLFGAGNG